MKCFIAFVCAMLVYKTDIIYSTTEFTRIKSQQIRGLYGNTVYHKIPIPALMAVHIIWSIWQLAFGVFYFAHNFSPEPNALLTITRSSNETSGFVFLGNEHIFAAYGSINEPETWSLLFKDLKTSILDPIWIEERQIIYMWPYSFQFLL